MNRLDIVKSFSDMSRNAGTTTFKISYTSTEGNLDIDKRFQEYCAEYANNEYLVGIGKLLDTFEHYKHLSALDTALLQLSLVVGELQSSIEKLNEAPVVKKEEGEKNATF